jgi:nicotinamide riboside kinase
MRIAFTGPESSGKTTFSKWLHQELPNSILILEYAREYLEQNQTSRASEFDFQKIVERQCSSFMESKSSLIEIFDTDIFVLRIWNEEVYKLNLPELEILPSYKMDIHFLCAPDVEWEDDPLRSAPDYSERVRLFNKYQTELANCETNFIILEGNRGQKEEQILRALRKTNSF